MRFSHHFFRIFPGISMGFSMGVFCDISMGIGFQRDFNGFSMGFLMGTFSENWISM